MGETDPNVRRVDIRTVLYGLAMVVSVATVTAGLSRFAWLADIQRVVDAHTIERSQWRSTIESRLGRAEEHCQRNREDHERLDRLIDGLQQWRSNCSVKQSEFASRLEQHDRQDDAAINAINKRQDWLEQQLRPRP